MKVQLLVFLILLPFFIIGQDWAPVGAKWVYDHDAGDSPYMTTIESIKDTVVKNKVCKLLVTKETDKFMRQDGSYYWGTWIVSKDYIYTSNDTIYHFDKYENSFYPLYVLSLKPNDTVLVREKEINCSKNEYFCSKFEYKVDSISNITLQGHDLRLIYNSAIKLSEWVFNRSEISENYPIIEKLGSVKYFFGVRKNFVMEGGISCLRCYHDDEISYKSSNWMAECDYVSLFVQENLITDFTVFPNPFDSFIKINIDNKCEFKLFDLFGRLLIQGYGKEINSSALQNGIYFLQFTVNSKESKVIKLIKQKI